MLPTPNQKIKATAKDPRKLVIYAHRKAGKTLSASFIKDSLILDMENGSDFIDAVKVNVLGVNPPKKHSTKESKLKRAKNGCFYLSELYNILDNEMEKNQGEYPYKRLIIDTGTKLDDWAIWSATEKHMRTTKGENFNRVDNNKKNPILPRSEWSPVTELAHGQGWGLHRVEFMDILETLHKYCHTLVIVCHVKLKEIKTHTKTVNVEEIDLSGKLAGITSSWADAVGKVYRKKDTTFISFKSTGGDNNAGTRIPWLAGKDFPLLEHHKIKDEEGREIDAVKTSDWSDIFED